MAPGAANTADEFIANKDENCEAGYIKLSVEPTGEKYTITIPGTGQQKEFETQSRRKK